MTSQLFKFFKDITNKDVYLIEDEVDLFKEKFAKIIRIFL
jgi:hypothetical protein